MQWLALDGTGDAARAAVKFANAALATRDWVALTIPSKQEQLLADDLTETTIRVGGVTVVYRRRDEGNWWRPPSEIRVGVEQLPTWRGSTESAGVLAS